MTDFLLKIFVKNYRDTGNPAVHSAIGRMAGIVGIVCNCLLAAGKLIIGLTIGSLSVAADGVNNLSDTASSVVTVLGFRLAQHPADRDHPYGHARYEYLSGLAVSMLILLVGAELVKSSVNRIFHPVPVHFTAAAGAVLLISSAVKIWMAVFFRTLGKRIRSDTLLAAAADSRNDAAAGAAVLLSCLADRFFGVHIDGFAGLAVAVFILYSGIGIARDTISPLLGRRADTELEKQLSELVLSHEGILGIHDLLFHDYGPGQCYASLHVEMSAEENPLLCHDIIDDIECDALEKLHVHLVIHYDPVIENDAEQKEMQAFVEQIICGMDPRLSLHDFRIVRGAERAKLVFDLSVPYSMTDRRGEIRKKIDEELARSGRAYTTVIRFDSKA